MECAKVSLVCVFCFFVFFKPHTYKTIVLGAYCDVVSSDLLRENGEKSVMNQIFARSLYSQSRCKVEKLNRLLLMRRRRAAEVLLPLQEVMEPCCFGCVLLENEEALSPVGYLSEQGPRLNV